MAPALWHCPDTYDPARTSRPDGPWCDGPRVHGTPVEGPCPGHKASKRVRDTADVLAWVNGYDGLAGQPEEWQQRTLDTAALCLADLGGLP